MLFLFIDNEGISDTADATFSSSTDSFMAVIVTLGRYLVTVSSDGDIAANADIRTNAFIAVQRSVKTALFFRTVVAGIRIILALPYETHWEFDLSRV